MIMTFSTTKCCAQEDRCGVADPIGSILDCILLGLGSAFAGGLDQAVES